MKTRTSALSSSLFLLAFLLGFSARAQTPLGLGINLQQQQPRLIWNSVNGGVYHVLSRPSLDAGSWERTATIIAEGATANWVDFDASAAARFYWLVQGDAPLTAQISVVHASTAPLIVPTLTNGTYAQVKSLIQSLAPLGQLRLPLPLPDLDPFQDIVVRDVQIYFDDPNRTITIWGKATMLNQPVELLATGNWPATAGVRPTFQLGIKLSELTLATLSQTFANSPLAGLDFKNSVIILGQDTGTIDPVKFPGKAYSFYNGAKIDIERGANFFKQMDLSALPILTGLNVLGLLTNSIALQGIVGIDPNIFFGAAHSLDPALLHLHSFLKNTPLRGQPGWISTTSRRLDLSMLGLVPPPPAGLRALSQPAPQLSVSLTDKLKIKVEDDELEFETVTDLSSLEPTTTITGTSHRPWEKPLGIDWLILSNLTVELKMENGEVVDAEISSTFFANGKEGEASINVPDAEDAAVEITLSADEFTREEIATFLQQHAGLTVSSNDLPQDLLVKEPKLTLKTSPKPKLTLTGKVSVLGPLKAEVLVTVVEREGQPDVLVSINADELKLSDLIPATDGTFLGEIALPVGGFTSGEKEQTIPSEELDPPARTFFQRIHEQSNFSVSVKTGVELDAVLPLSAFPTSALQALGLNSTDRVVLKGLANVTLGILTKNGPLNLDRLRLEADLPLNTLPGVPASFQPMTVLSRRLVLTYEPGALNLVLESSVIVTIDGKPVTLAFRASLANPTQAGSVQLVGTMTSPWSQPFGIDWLTLEQVQLRLAAAGSTGEGVLTGRLLIGGKSVETSVELLSLGGQPSAKLRATLDQLSLTDLISFAQQRFGVSPFGDQPPGGLLDLRQLTFEIQSAPTPQFTVSANATVLNNLPTKVLFTVVRKDGQNEPVLSLGLENFNLGSLSSRLSGATAGDMKFPSTAYTFSRKPLSMPSSDLSGEARAFFQKIYGQSDFTFKTDAGVSFGAQLPLSLLPPKALSILGMNATDKVALEGTVGISFGMLSGSVAVDLTQLDLQVALPNARPAKLPAWLAVDPAVQRTLAFSYRNLPGPENALAIRVTDRITVTLDDARRTFVLSTAVSSAGELSFDGTMLGSWSKPFGVDWLTLDQVSLNFTTDGIQSEGSLRSSFPLGNKRIDLGIIVAGGTNGPSVELKGAVNQLSIDDVIELARRQIDRPLFPGSPPADFATLNNVAMTIRLGATKSLSIGATAQLAGRQTELLWSMESSPGQETHILLGMQPSGWTLSGAFPGLSNPIVDGLTLPTPTLVFANFEKQKDPSQLQTEEKTFYSKVFGPGNFSLKVPSGLGLLGGIPVNSLPVDGALRQLLKVLGMQPDNLLIEGSLGNSLSLLTGGATGADALKGVSLKVALPPMRPKDAPAWFKSGQLALEITGAPSFGVAGEVTVEVEGDILTFFIKSGISFPGPSLQLVGGLKATGGWTSPFGVEWLTLHELIVLIGVDATGSAKLGFSGDMIIGEKDIHVAALVAVNATGVPTNLILEGSSVEGLALSDIAALQAKMAATVFPGAATIPIDRLPDMAMKNIALKFAPRPEPSLNIERGLAFSGDFYLQVQRGGPLERVATARFKVGEGEISAAGEMSSGSIGPVSWTDPYVDLMLSRDAQHFFVGGYTSSQFLTGDLDLALSRDDMRFSMDARILNQFDVNLNSQSQLNIVTPTFPINGNMLADFLSSATSDAKARFGEISNQGKTAIANAQSLVNDALNLKNLKDLEIGGKIQDLIEELDLAKRAMDAAKALRDSALSALNSARVARDRAWDLYVATPSWQPVLKAAYYTDYLAKAAIYQTRNVAYQAANNSYYLAKTAYEIIPPIDQNPVIIALRSELNELAARLELRRQQLSSVTQTFRTIIDAVTAGLISIESASFNTTLRDLIETRRTSMTITLNLGGQRRTFTPTWDFNRNIRENLKPVVDQILREQGII